MSTVLSSSDEARYLKEQKDEARYLEEQKLVFEFAKHMTTLSTGTIVLLATFLKDVFKQPEWSS